MDATKLLNGIYYTSRSKDFHYVIYYNHSGWYCHKDDGEKVGSLESYDFWTWEGEDTKHLKYLALPQQYMEGCKSNEST